MGTSIFQGHNDPICLGAFQATEDDHEALVQRYRAQGYSHFLSAHIPNQETSQDYRHTAMPELFFKGNPPSWDTLAQGHYSGANSVVGVLFIMTSVGQGIYVGEFSGKPRRAIPLIPLLFSAVARFLNLLPLSKTKIGKDLAELIAFWQTSEAGGGTLKDVAEKYARVRRQDTIRLDYFLEQEANHGLGR